MFFVCGRITNEPDWQDFYLKVWPSLSHLCQALGATNAFQETRLFSHIFLGVRDFERAFGFYSALMPCLGNVERFCDRGRPWAGWQSADASRPLFLIGTPYDGTAHEPGNGQMVAFLAGSRPVVDSAYRIALVHGGISEGAPGLRLEYHENYYGAYFRDTEGNKLCVACHLLQA